MQQQRNGGLIDHHLHRARAILDELRTREHRPHEDIEVLITILEVLLEASAEIAAAVQQVTDDFNRFKSDVATALDNLRSELASAEAQIPDPTVLQGAKAALDTLDQSVKDADASVTPPAQPPASPGGQTDAGGGTDQPPVVEPPPANPADQVGPSSAGG